MKVFLGYEGCSNKLITQVVNSSALPVFGVAIVGDPAGLSLVPFVGG